MTTTERQHAALERAQGGASSRNDAEVITGFVRRGIPADQIKPRVNALTYNAWRAKGRQVRRGEKGVGILTWIPVQDKADPATGTVKRGGMRPRRATVFHVTQTDPA